MSRNKMICLIAGAAVGLATAASAQVSRDEGNAQAAEFAAHNTSLASALQAAAGPTAYGFTKFRYVVNTRDETLPVGAEDTAIGFMNAETRIGFMGDVDGFSYRVDGNFDPEGEFSLNYAYVDHSYDNGWTVTAGQTKAPFLREELVDDTGLLDMSRSIVNTAFSAGYTQGIFGRYETEDWRVTGGFNDGAGATNSDFTSGAESDFAFDVRFEYKIQGNEWDAFNDFTSFNGSDTSYMAGGAIHYQTGGETFASGPAGATADVDIIGLTGDFTAEGNGWNAFAYFVWVNTDPAVGADTDSFGILAQAGWFADDAWELFGSYAWTSPDDDTMLDDFSAITVGVNYYFVPESHAAVFTADVVFFLDEQSLGIVPENTENALLSSAEDSQFAFRGQLQLVF